MRKIRQKGRAPILKILDLLKEYPMGLSVEEIAKMIEVRKPIVLYCLNLLMYDNKNYSITTKVDKTRGVIYGMKQ